MKYATGLLLALACSGAFALEPAQRTLTLEDRVTAQKAIEQVYWNHRIWPKENPGPKPPLAALVPDELLRQRVSAQADQRALLRSYWNTRLSGDDVQGEIDRMIRGSKDPAMLRELFAALGNDPALIAEGLARPQLEGRLVEAAFARDVRIHGAQREKIAQELADVAGPEGLKRLSGKYAEVTVALKGETSAEARHDPETGAVLELEPDEWNELIARLSGRFGVAPPDARALSVPLTTDQQLAGLPIRVVAGLDERDDAFVASAVLYRQGNTLRLASVSWPKIGLAEWMKSPAGVSALAASRSVPDDGNIAAPQGGYTAAATSSVACVDDSWRKTWMVGLAGRWYHTAVWTGTEMIVWGGIGDAGYLNTGDRYNPSTDTWASSSLTTGTGANVPSARGFHTAVWTGTEMIVWGGFADPGYLNTGSRYNPSTDSWSSSSLTAGSGANVPAPRRAHTAVWTGTEMIVWGGGNSNALLNTGGRYNPLTDSWSSSSLTAGSGANVPFARASHTAVWTGTEMIVWGGNASAPYLNTGGRYNPSTDTWSSNSLTTGTGANVPAARYLHTAVWTGTEMIVWGGHGNAGYLNSGGRYNPSTDSWASSSLTAGTGANVPDWRERHSVVWTGVEMIVWGGFGNGNALLNTGGRYNPSTDTWASSSLTTGTGANVPFGRYLHTAVWTGTEMIVWGGFGDPGYLNTGGRYNPSTDSWASSSLATGAGANLPSPRRNHTVVWTGTEMIVWGGYGGALYLNTGGRYNPSTDSWASSSLVTGAGANVPFGRYLHTAVWTGTEMIVWGGVNGSAYYDTGGRYNPSTDSWASSSLTAGTGANVPSARIFHTAVWTGAEMIVWGGRNGSAAFNAGGRYNPSTDSWASSSLTTGSGANVPSARYAHTAVWTGTELIVWGGGDNVAPFNTGGRYNPSTDSWASSSLSTGTGANVPSARGYHTAAWTGTEMIVWGGWDGGIFYNTGGRYNPSTDSWATSALTTGAGANVPFARASHAAVWTGTEMIVWGGLGIAYYNTGGRYNPSTDSWASSSLTTGSGTNVPSARSYHTAAWTGTEMIVWGGWNGSTGVNTGGRYNPSADSWESSGLTAGFDANAPAARYNHTSVWTGAEMIVWGGQDGTVAMQTGGRYVPATDSWAPSVLNTGMGANTPSSRWKHSAVWTGTELVVWGGWYNDGTLHYLNTGGRYNPAADRWASSSLTGGSGANVPSAREAHGSVWTGTEMIVWGGYGDAGYLNTGGRYDPVTDGWVATSNGPNVPSGREPGASVWTGTKMIVWGGWNGSALGDGARYAPATDTWIPVSAGANVPAARGMHAAVWTGTEMIVWGGWAGVGSNTLSNGGRYNPSTDTWAPSSLTNGSGANVPISREYPTAVWTGTEMIVWGGDYTSGGLVYRTNTGGRYNPSTDRWASSSLVNGTGVNTPSARDYHTAVLAGPLMIVWGGYDGTNVLGDGAAYCTATCSTVSWYQDLDGDGYGNSAVNTVSCTRPPGYVALAGDCDDANPAVHPGAAEICNGIDDGCNGVVDDGGGDALCNDGNMCTDDLCNGASGCTHTNSTAPCNDGNSCTAADTCIGGACIGTPVSGPPPEVQNLTVAANKTTFNWSAIAGPIHYDVVRGSIGAFPVGPGGGDEVCFDNRPTTTLVDLAVPLPGAGFWYLSRAESGCGLGTWGNATSGPRVTTTCP